jgi:hypothetical protein
MKTTNKQTRSGWHNHFIALAIIAAVGTSAAFATAPSHDGSAASQTLTAGGQPATVLLADDAGGPPKDDQGGGGPGGGGKNGGPPNHGEPRLPPQIAHALDDMTLTDAQQPKVDAAVAAFKQKVAAAQAELLRNLKATLTADQYAALKEAMTQPPPPPPGNGGGDNNGGGGGGGGGAGGGGGNGGGGNGPPPPNN